MLDKYMKTISSTISWRYFWLPLFIAGTFFLIIFIVKFDGNITGFYRIGSVLPKSSLLNGIELFVHEGKRGNDGQLFLALALDPLLLNPTTISALDSPWYRAKRIMYPTVGWLLGLGSPKRIIWSLTLVNLLLIAVIVSLTASWLDHYCQQKAWALSIIAIPSIWMILSISTSDLLCATFSLAALLFYKKQNSKLTTLFMALAILTRETAILLLLVLIFTAFLEKKYSFLRSIWLAPIPFAVWNIYLLSILTPEKITSLFSAFFDYPLSGMVSKIHSLLTPEKIGAEYFFDIFTFILLLIVIANGIVVALRNRKIFPEISTLFFAQIIIFSTYKMNILGRFLDYTRVCTEIYLVAFMMLPWSNKFFRIIIPTIAALASIGYLAGFLFESV
jgi:hypothetical protein